MAALVAAIHVYALIIPVRWLTNRPRMQEFGEGRRWQNIFQFSNLIGASRSGRVSLSVPSENRYSSPGHRWPSERTRNGSKNEGEGLQEEHPGRQKVGQACGWQEVEENCKDVSREETTEARDQPERRKPTQSATISASPSPG